MEKQIFDLINRNFEEVRNNTEYYLKIQLGKYVSSNIFDDILCMDDETFINFLNNNPKYKNVSENEFYQYQYQNQYYQRSRNYKSNIFTDNLIDYEVNHNTKDMDYRFSIHKKIPLTLFSQRMSYHNIVFIKEYAWQLTDECQLIFNKNIKQKNESYHIYFNIKIPLSELSLKKIIKEINDVLSFFKHKYDKKHKFHSLDSVLEFEQPLQE
jgi:hypothetical protein